MKKKQFYEKPSMQVVEVKQQVQLLAGSAKRGQMDDPEDYELKGDPFQF